MSWTTGLDRLLAEGVDRLRGRRYGLLGHGASLTRDLVPAHLALAGRDAAPAALFGPEHGYYGVEQDMAPAADARDPWIGVPILSLYGETVDTLRPDPSAFRGLDLLVVDLQDVGARYYTYAATAVWAAEAALAAGCEVWVLDRPNPIGSAVEGNLLADGYTSFVGAFPGLPPRHGLTFAELVRWQGRRLGWDDQAVTCWTLDGWDAASLWPAQVGARAFLPPSPNMPTVHIALLYPGGCLIEATELSEGRGTTRPFQLAGAPGLDPRALAARLDAASLPGIAFVPTYFKPQFQKHAGAVCGGVELFVTDPDTFRPYRTGVELLWALRAEAPERFAWRHAPYEFVTDQPAVDLLAGTDHLRLALDAGDRAALDAWIASWPADEAAFRAECEDALLYPRPAGDAGRSR
ncbi:MAG TPA: DUF1343 domain-containing protein [Thermoanaerobaculia bacterium]|nr:DUF1343 domain-containing protein [Thermoanaerobaculia bacterium]